MRVSLLVGRFMAIALLWGIAGPSSAQSAGQTAPPPASRVSMSDAVRLALERNHELHAQRLNVDLSKADETLRRAYSLAGSDPRIRANRALVLGLQGRMNEAEVIARADLPPDEAAASVAALKQILAKKKTEANAADKMPTAHSGRLD